MQMKQHDADKSHLGRLLCELVGFDPAGDWGFREALASIRKISRVGSGEDSRVHVYGTVAGQLGWALPITNLS